MRAAYSDAPPQADGNLDILLDAHHDEPMAQIPTTREIAQACGFHQSTVSRALSNKSRIPAETRERILKVAREMGWRPNPLASAYMSHLRSTHPPSYQATLGFIFCEYYSGRIAELELHMQRTFYGARRRAMELGYSLEHFWLKEPGMNEHRLGRILRSRGIPGIVISSGVTELPNFPWEHFSTVAIGYDLKEPAHHRVVINTAHGFHLAARRAFELGYRRLGVIVTKRYDSKVDHGVFYPVSYEKERLAPGQSIVTLELESDDRSQIPLVQEWIRREQPEIILGIELVWQAIRHMKLRVPQDIAYISVDWSPEFGDIAGFNQRHDVRGPIAIEMLIGLLGQNERGIPELQKTQSVDGNWKDGLTAPPAAEQRLVTKVVNSEVDPSIPVSGHRPSPTQLKKAPVIDFST